MSISENASSGCPLGDTDICKSAKHQKTSTNTANKEKHKRLADVVKGVHSQLRKKFRQSPGDLEGVWRAHCDNKGLLCEYSAAMHKLATEIWTKHVETRIDWCYKTCIEFFHRGGLVAALQKEERRRRYHESQLKQTSAVSSDSAKTSCDETTKTDLCADSVCNPDAGRRSDKLGCSRSCSSSLPESVCASGCVVRGLEEGGDTRHSERRQHNTVELPFTGPIRLLDVGSCYNPFLVFDEFQPIGIDLSPAVDTVYKCDFLSLGITEPLHLVTGSIDSYIHSIQSPVEELPSQSFHTVIFSLLLEYMPSARQRWLCCEKAHKLLMVHGLLVIITPDSHHQNRNAPMIKSWKTCIEALGFKRWRYEKMEHLHCMAFRKISERAGTDAGNDSLTDMLYIPQDLHDDNDDVRKDSGGCQTATDDNNSSDTFLELPLCIDS